jgi:hypothetical protein|nr:MAG TPA: exonuclease [Caudoviricetes sp.]
MSSSIKLEFIEETHTYIKNGIILKSVTQILQELFPLKYDNVPKKILEDKSIYGTELHKFIEIIEKKKPKKPLAYIKRYYKPNIYQEESLKDYLKIKDKYKIEITDSEKMISYKMLYAGTLDLKGYVNGKSAIIDIKTTYELDELYVAWQNSLYELADGKVDELYCLWLPKGRLGKLVKLERIDKNYLLAII